MSSDVYSPYHNSHNASSFVNVSSGFCYHNSCHHLQSTSTYGNTKNMYYIIDAYLLLYLESETHVSQRVVGTVINQLAWTSSMLWDIPQVTNDIARACHVILQLIVWYHCVKERLGATWNLLCNLNLHNVQVVTQLNNDIHVQQWLTWWQINCTTHSQILNICPFILLLASYSHSLHTYDAAEHF